MTMMTRIHKRQFVNLLSYRKTTFTKARGRGHTNYEKTKYAQNQTDRHISFMWEWEPRHMVTIQRKAHCLGYHLHLPSNSWKSLLSSAPLWKSSIDLPLADWSLCNVRNWFSVFLCRWHHTGRRWKDWPLLHGLHFRLKHSCLLCQVSRRSYSTLSNTHHKYYWSPSEPKLLTWLYHHIAYHSQMWK